MTRPVEVRDAFDRGGATAVATMLRSRAEGGDPEAQYWLGCMHFLGLEETPSARTWFERAAELGHLEALFRLSTMIEGEEGDSILLRAAEGGSVRAAEAAGVRYATGEWTFGQNLEEARTWYRTAALGGSATGAYELGLMLVLGEGGNRNVAEGIGWLVNAIARRSREAARALASLFEEGTLDVPADKALARMWRERERELGEEGEARADPLGDFVPRRIGEPQG